MPRGAAPSTRQPRYAELQLQLTEMRDPVTAIAISPDSLNVAAVSYTGEVRVWGILDGTNYVFNEPTIRTPQSDEIDVWPNMITFSPNGRFLAVAVEKKVHLWIARTGQWKFHLDHEGDVTSVVFLTDSKQLACGSKKIFIWNVETRQVVLILKGHTDYVSCISCFPGGAKLASASSDSTIRIWDLEEGKLTLKWLKDTWAAGRGIHPVYCCAVSPDGQLLVSGDSYMQVIVWQVESGDWLERPYLGHSTGVQSVSFSPDGKYVASASSAEVHVQDSKSGACIAKVDRGDTLVAYTPDGKHIVTRDNEDPKLIRVLKLATPVGPLIGAQYNPRAAGLSAIEVVKPQGGSSRQRVGGSRA